MPRHWSWSKHHGSTTSAFLRQRSASSVRSARHISARTVILSCHPPWLKGVVDYWHHSLPHHWTGSNHHGSATPSCDKAQPHQSGLMDGPYSNYDHHQDQPCRLQQRQLMLLSGGSGRQTDGGFRGSASSQEFTSRTDRKTHLKLCTFG